MKKYINFIACACIIHMTTYTASSKVPQHQPSDIVAILSKIKPLADHTSQHTTPVEALTDLQRAQQALIEHCALTPEETKKIEPCMLRLTPLIQSALSKPGLLPGEKELLLIISLAQQAPASLKNDLQQRLWVDQQQKRRNDIIMSLAFIQIMIQQTRIYIKQNQR